MSERFVVLVQMPNDAVRAVITDDEVSLTVFESETAALEWHARSALKNLECQIVRLDF